MSPATSECAGENLLQSRDCIDVVPSSVPMVGIGMTELLLTPDMEVGHALALQIKAARAARRTKRSEASRKGWVNRV